MKTKLTKQLEETLYAYCMENGAVPVEEVTMPDNRGIVDTLSYQQLPDGQTEWRCYELKVTKTDFHSKAQLSFIGHYNYFVLPYDLYVTVATEIPTEIGVLSYQPYDAIRLAQATDPVTTPGYLTVEKKARYQDLGVAEDLLTNHFIHSLNREVYKAKQAEQGLGQFSSHRLYKELKKRYQHYDISTPETNFYDQFIEDTQSSAVLALQEEVDALNLELAELQAQLRGNPS
ncbi:hypothetical protein [Secundilactobacillus kimchicus]|uniref:hypothetical protein n=1 Tax=Secundilactobacillus kimchicus TaxID=528209 RepID=UPI0024A8BC3B|nr:hypothetical protein [Secundilactobacillus kimchicus]